MATTKTLRRRCFSLAGRITRKARRLTVHLATGLALAEPVRLRSRQTARPAATFLAAPTAFTGLLNRLPDLRQGVPACLLLQSGR